MRVEVGGVVVQSKDARRATDELEHLVGAADTGGALGVSLVTQPPGIATPLHRHTHESEALFVLEGTLDTHQGRFPAGSFVWFPEGGIMQHGATRDGDCTFLFMTNKPLDIHFVGDESDPRAPKV